MTNKILPIALIGGGVLAFFLLSKQSQATGSGGGFGDSGYSGYGITPETGGSSLVSAYPSIPANPFPQTSEILRDTSIPDTQTYSLYTSSGNLLGEFSKKQLSTLSSGGAVYSGGSTFKISDFGSGNSYTDTQAKKMLSAEAYAKYSANKPTGLTGAELLKVTPSSGGANTTGTTPTGSNTWTDSTGKTWKELPKKKKK